MPEANLVSIGIILIFLGFLLIFVGTLTGKTDAKVGVGGIIGFLPFGFGNDPQIVKLAIIISAVLAILFIVLALKGML